MMFSFVNVTDFLVPPFFSRFVVRMSKSISSSKLAKVYYVFQLCVSLRYSTSVVSCNFILISIFWWNRVHIFILVPAHSRRVRVKHKNSSTCDTVSIWFHCCHCYDRHCLRPHYYYGRNDSMCSLCKLSVDCSVFTIRFAIKIQRAVFASPPEKHAKTVQIQLTEISAFILFFAVFLLTPNANRSESVRSRANLFSLQNMYMGHSFARARKIRKIGHDFVARMRAPHKLTHQRNLTIPTLFNWKIWKKKVPVCRLRNWQRNGNWLSRASAWMQK